jgi:hypothetical protein
MHLLFRARYRARARYRFLIGRWGVIGRRGDQTVGSLKSGQ